MSKNTQKQNPDKALNDAKKELQECREKVEGMLTGRPPHYAIHGTYQMAIDFKKLTKSASKLPNSCPNSLAGVQAAMAKYKKFINEWNLFEKVM